MTLKIEESTNIDLLAKLNKEIQDIHVKIAPDIFKEYDFNNMKSLFRKMLQCENTTAYVSYCDNIPCGYMIISVKEYEENAFKKYYKYSVLEHLCVAEEFRGKGIGSEMIYKFIDISKENNVSRIELDCWVDNENAYQFYIDKGFEPYSSKMNIK